MPLREADRRGRAVRGSAGLLERDDALASIGELLDEARAGTGDALLISGHPGMGKTRLHEATLDESRPAVVAIDDLHWCDLASLEFVLYLLHRLDELPAALVLTSRMRPGGAGAEILDQISVHPRLDTTELTPLGVEAVDELVRARLGERADRALVEVCAQVTAGNPFYLHELLLALAEERQLDTGQLARLARALAPDTVTRSLRVRVGRLGPQATALASAVAILGDDVPLRHAAALSGLEIAEAGAAADALAGVEVLLAREPLRFVHPLVRQ